MKRLSKKLASIVSLVCATALLAACGGNSAPAQSSQPAQESAASTEEAQGEQNMSDISVAFIVSDLANPFFAKLVQRMTDYSNEIGITFTANESVEISDKISSIENYISGGTDVIICHVSDAEALKEPALRAEEAGVRFISYDMDIEGTSAFVGIDNHEYGYMIGKNAAEWVVDNFDSSEQVKVGLCTYPDYPFLVVRAQGIRDALTEIAPNTEVVVDAKAGTVPEGVDVGEAWTQSNPDLNVVVGINDAGVVGVYNAYNSAGLLNDKLGMFGGDATDDALALIQEDTNYLATVSTNMLLHYDYFIDAAVELAQKGSLENRDILFPLSKVDGENVDAYIAENE